MKPVAIGLECIPSALSPQPILSELLTIYSPDTAVKKRKVPEDPVAGNLIDKDLSYLRQAIWGGEEIARCHKYRLQVLGNLKSSCGCLGKQAPSADLCLCLRCCWNLAHLSL
eukprot:1147899-Pelagomonas_calceolata.AAC.2